LNNAFENIALKIHEHFLPACFVFHRALSPNSWLRALDYCRNQRPQNKTGRQKH